MCLLTLLSFRTHGQNEKDVEAPDSTLVIVNLSELPRQVEEDGQKVRDLLSLAEDTAHIESYKSSMAALEGSVAKAIEQSDYFLQSYARLWVIQNLSAKWIRLNDDWVDLSIKISNSTKNVETRLRTCQEMISKWTNLKETIAGDSVSASLNKPVSDLINNLDQVERLFQGKIKIYLNFQEKVAINRTEINRYLEILTPLRNQDFITFFRRDEDFIWNQLSDSTRFDVQMATSFRFASRDIIDYLRSAIAKIVFVFILGIFFFLLFKRNSKRYVQAKGDEPPQTDQLLRSLQFPLTYAYTFTLLFALLTLTNRPPLLTEFLLLLFTFSLVILIVKRSSGIVKIITVSILILYWLDFLSDFLITDPSISRDIDLFNAIATSLLLLVIYRNRSSVKTQFPRLNDFVLRIIIPLFLVINTLTVILQVWGFTMLGRAFTTGTITFMYLMPVIIVCSIALQDLFHVLQDAPFVKYSNLARNYYHLIFRGIHLGAFYLLFVTFLASFSLTSLFISAWDTIWNFGGQFGEFNITVGDVLEFFIIVFISWTISVVLKVLLTDEILARANLRRGVPMAIGVIVRYTVVFLGFILAVASTGFDLAKISILAGGLGVGIGFGLQHLVANFIAGLILIFERPIVVGDTVESEQIEGEVKQIGIRSSRILTYDGAEVIIPNSNLINNKLSNWTLSSHSRRQLILVRTSAKADAEKVLEILNRIARQHANVLATPEPFVLFEGQLDQSLQFKIYYWLVSEIFKTRCELNIQIYRELKELGVELPIPIQEIRTNADTIPTLTSRGS